jgi:hypothetical protein
LEGDDLESCNSLRQLHRTKRKFRLSDLEEEQRDWIKKNNAEGEILGLTRIQDQYVQHRIFTCFKKLKRKVLDIKMFRHLDI